MYLASFRFGLNKFWYNFEKILHIYIQKGIWVADDDGNTIYSTWDSIILHLYNYTIWPLSLCNYTTDYMYTDICRVLHSSGGRRTCLYCNVHETLPYRNLYFK